MGTYDPSRILRSQTPQPPVLPALLFGNFVVGSGVSVVSGTLPEISASLAVSVAEAGQIITASSLVVALAAPLSVSLVANWDRRRLLALAMAWYGALHLLCALMPSLGSLTAVRMVAMVAPAIFTPQAAACVGLLVPVEMRGRAITFVFLGFSVASVLGLPVSAFVGGMFGWRHAFALVGLMGLVSAIWIWRTMPRGVRPPALALAAWGRLARAPALTSCLAVTLLFGSAQFILYSYLAPYFKLRVGVTTPQLSLLFMWFGAFGLAGNAIMSRSIDRVGAARATMVSLMLSAFTLLLWPLGTGFLLAALVMTPWALGYFSATSAQQARLVGIAPALAPASVALNTSAVYAGQGIGTAIGGMVITQGRWDALHWIALCGVLIAMMASAGSSWLAARSRCHA